MDDLKEKIAKAAADYKAGGKHVPILEPHREAVLLMRAKGASYEAITDVLQENGLTVSIHTVRHLCRRNTAEIKRIKLGLQNEETPESPGPSMQTDHVPIPLPAQASRRPKRSLRGPV